MKRRSLVSLAALGALMISPLVAPRPASAAEFTDLLDAADDFDDLDEATWDPFDFNIEPSFRFFHSRAKISREAPCVPTEPFADKEDSELTEGELRIKNNPRLVVGEDRCSEPRTVYNKEMDFTGQRAQLDVNLRAGIYKDLEFRLNVPYVFSNTRQLTYDNLDANPERNVDETNSSVDPRTSCDDGSAGRCIEREAANVFAAGDSPAELVDQLDDFTAYRYFELGEEVKHTRSGFAEPSIGLHWAMFNDQRDPTKATMLLGMDYTMPIVPVARRENSAIGRGMHELDFTLSSSKQFKWIEPYFGLNYNLPIASARSPIREIDVDNRGQVFVNPPMSGEITIGSEFIPYENIEKGQRYGIDLRFTFGYVSEGRDYTPLFDHFTQSSCNGKTLNEVLPQFDSNGQITNPDDVACAWIAREPANGEIKPVYDLEQAARDGNDDRFFTDGIMTVEGHGVFRGLFGLYLQPAQNFQFKALVSLEHTQEHFLTNSRTGRDAPDDDEAPDSPDDTVDLEGPDAALERNPVYNPTFDSAGERFRVQAYNTWMFMVTTAIQF